MNVLEKIYLHKVVERMPLMFLNSLHVDFAEGRKWHGQQLRRKMKKKDSFPKIDRLAVVDRDNNLKK